jgi:hypothetical protein
MKLYHSTVPDHIMWSLTIAGWQQASLWMVTSIKFDPLFLTIRNEPEFRQIVRDVEEKYHAEHERVRKWLEERGEL